MAESQKQAAAGTTAQAAEGSLLDSVLKETKQVEPDRAKSMIEELVKGVGSGIISFDKNVARTIQKAIDLLDGKLSKQLTAIMHHPDFQKLEGTWRGFSYLVFNTETSAQLKLKVLNVSKKDLAKNLDKAVEFDQSELFKKLYENEFGSPGGEPYGALIGDYEFTSHPDDMAMLEKISGVAAAAFCPFISAASPKLFGFDSFTELSKPRDLERIFQSAEYVKWKSFRDSEDSRFTVLTLPRTLARLPYGQNTKPIEEFNFQEADMDSKGKDKAMAHDKYTWMNAAWVYGSKLTASQAKWGWCTAIRGYENGGKVEGLPAHVFQSDDGSADLKCPTEIGITDRREAELSKLGFLPLSHYKNTDYAVFFGGQTVQKPKKYDTPIGTSNAELSACLPYIMAMSRMAHFLKVIARDKIGAFMERGECQDWLTRWIMQYRCADEKPSAEIKAQYPLADAKVEVEADPEKPGAYHAKVWLRPWLQMEALTTSMRLVARIPQKA